MLESTSEASPRLAVPRLEARGLARPVERLRLRRTPLPPDPDSPADAPEVADPVEDFRLRRRGERNRSPLVRRIAGPSSSANPGSCARAAPSVLLPSTCRLWMNCRIRSWSLGEAEVVAIIPRIESMISLEVPAGSGIPCRVESSALRGAWSALLPAPPFRLSLRAILVIAFSTVSNSSSVDISGADDSAVPWRLPLTPPATTGNAEGASSPELTIGAAPKSGLGEPPFPVGVSKTSESRPGGMRTAPRPAGGVGSRLDAPVRAVIGATAPPHPPRAAATSGVKSLLSGDASASGFMNCSILLELPGSAVEVCPELLFDDWRPHPGADTPRLTDAPARKVRSMRAICMAIDSLCAWLSGPAA
mmetsp:Transcript_19531/g.62183  ORF Transcript_19531/g.62183 Transcript_19531/m.62183 type:complete len:362 (-) Transcript_19531:1864-2949(-)